LAERCSFAKPENRHWNDSIDEGLCSTDCVSEAGPSSAWRGEVRAVFRLVGVSDASEFGWIGRRLRHSFEYEIKTLKSVAPGCDDALTVR
jgi:hypothetical protein